MKLLFLAPTIASALMVSPMTKVTPRAPLVSMGVVDSVKTSVVPDNTDQTLRNAFGLQAVGWGVGGLVVPNAMMTTLFGTAISGASVPLMRGLGVANLLLGVRMCKGSDSEAAATGFLFFAVWYKLLTKAVAAGTIGGYGAQIALWNGLCALSAARRQGGLFDTLTKLDMSALTNLLPNDREVSVRNIVGVQTSIWGVICTFYQSFFFGSKLLGCAAGTMGALTASGIGLAALLLGGKVTSGSEDDAASTGLVLFGAWATIGWLGKAAGVFTGSYMAAVTIWNAAVAAYCLTKML